MRSVIGEVEVAEYMYPKLMVDKGGSVWFMFSREKGFVIKLNSEDDMSCEEKYNSLYGPLKDFHGTITLSNS